jgi:hypothetical protein
MLVPRLVHAACQVLFLVLVFATGPLKPEETVRSTSGRVEPTYLRALASSAKQPKVKVKGRKGGVVSMHRATGGFDDQ